MKFNMKKLFFTFFLLIFSFNTFAQETPTPQQDPLLEGTRIEITAEDVKDLQQWIDNAKTELEDLSAGYLRFKSAKEKRSIFSLSFTNTVRESKSKDNEIYVRIILNRALMVDKFLGNPQNNTELEMIVKFLSDSVVLASKNYSDDIAYLKAVGNPENSSAQKDIASFALEYFNFITERASTTLNPFLEYHMTRAALGWLANDFNSSRNLERVKYSTTIEFIRRSLAQNPVFVPETNTQILLQSIKHLKFDIRSVIKDNLDSFRKVEQVLERERLAKIQLEEDKKQIWRKDFESCKESASYITYSDTRDSAYANCHNKFKSSYGYNASDCRSLSEKMTSIILQDFYYGLCQNFPAEP